jgi:hypothetical protein
LAAKLARKVLEESAGWTLQVALLFVEDMICLNIIALGTNIWLARQTALTRVVTLESE